MFKLKTPLKVIIMIAFTLLGTYVGLYLMFIGGIAQFIDAIKLDPVSSKDVAGGVIKVLFASPVGYFIFYISILINIFLIDEKFPKARR